MGGHSSGARSSSAQTDSQWGGGAPQSPSPLGLGGSASIYHPQRGCGQLSSPPPDHPGCPGEQQLCFTSCITQQSAVGQWTPPGKLISVSCSSSSCSLSSEEGSGTDSPGELLGRQKGESCRATFQLEWSQSQHPAEHPMAGVRTELPAATPGHPTKPGEASTSCQSCYGAP